MDAKTLAEIEQTALDLARLAGTEIGTAMNQPLIVGSREAVDIRRRQDI